MKKLAIIILLFAARNGLAASPVTNLVEILPRIDALCRALELDVPHPLTVSAVTQWRPYRGKWPIPFPEHGIASIGIGQLGFAWDVAHDIVWSYGDREHASRFFYKVDVEGSTPPKTPGCLLAVQRGASVMTTNEAITLAEQIRGSLAAIGYATNACGKVSIQRPSWRIDDKDVDLPIYVIKWAWTAEPEMRFMEVEIDGLRRKPTSFVTLQGSPGYQQTQRKRMSSLEPEP